jgi:ATP-dependent Zn protease
MYSAAQISIGDDDQPECERASVHLARIVMLLAGSAMERLVLGESTTGGMRDLHTATDLAIERFDQGMDLDAPYVALSAWQHPAESLVEAQASSVVRTLADARSQAEELVREHRDQVIAFARLLYEARTLSGTALADALRAADVDPAEGGARTPAERP